ncbi:tRNA1(Val) (adenine(37)-N6)-methyltransferase [Reichenbachiella versicolor]|uniref:tRNA1(Val) (adenine(37)-N6)-methyltransferase n=1 Tax=Reichenbachiella versicolor TaxID=1821036 RepID=UPI000D6E4CF7|nr:methyltransferase [Reichenbachiella versicolor]
MPNSYFQFKQFKINQGQCAMKVSTEACLFGAWVQANSAERILDIGAGTGLLSLMLAQRFDAVIDSVEIDEGAAHQASENFKESPWSDRLNIHHKDIQSFAESSSIKYDLIISNPPFFKSSLKSLSSTRNLALHQSEGLSASTLSVVIDKVLSNEGKAFVLYPEYESQLFSLEAKAKNLFAKPALIVKNQPNKGVFRIISEVQRNDFDAIPEQISIRDGKEYTNEFVGLLKDYYLHL